MSGSGDGQSHGVRSRSSKGLQTFAMDKSIRSDSLPSEASIRTLVRAFPGHDLLRPRLPY
jgi:hypothetical protein